MDLRPWLRTTHLCDFTNGEWRPMYDDAGIKLPGIEGKCGVRARKADGSWIGGDFIRMQPHSAFPLHTHDGEHVIYFIYGKGFVHIDGEDVPVSQDHLIHIPAEHPHSVWCSEQPLVFLAVGHPHQHVGSTKRMKVHTKSFSGS
ncbi:MAG: hypothetical protein C5B60_03465 [Chloroflexi bacterium]|nr:MAG: hypothetical protein C5B60_03465 [Chloroflexota bacterium]